MKAITSKMARIAVLVTAVVAMGGCASTPNTFANADPSIDFGQYRTFAFAPSLGTDYNDYESMETNFLKAALTQEMTRRGLTQSGTPDLVIDFDVQTKEKIRSHSVPTGGFYSFYDPFYDVYGTAYGGGWRTEVRQHTEGTLSIGVIDAASKKLIWEGTAVGRITDKHRKNLEITVNDAVAEIMMGYPVVAAS